MANTIEFDRLVSYFDADLTPLEKGVARGIKLVDSLEKRLKDFKGKINLTGGTGTGSTGRSPIDREMQAAQADIRRFERERLNAERAVTRTVEREARLQAQARTREHRRSMNQMLADSRRRQREESAASGGGAMSAFGGRSAFMSGLAGGGAAGLLIGAGGSLSAMAKEGRDAYLTLDRLVRFVSTLDRSFQTPQMLAKLKADIEQISTVVPQEADAIAKAAFTVKSAYSKLTEPELIAFLRTLSVQATASNTTVDLHAERVAALAKMYGITAGELDKFGAILSTAFGDALASDAAVGEGFNKILVSARVVKQPLNEVAAAMGAIQSTSSDAEKNTTNLQNVFSKLGDPKYIQGLKEVFNIDVFDKTGSYKGLNAIVNELAKSLQGLSDKEKSVKIGEVFKDLQAREGLLSLVDVLDQYNARLRDGADAETWKAKQDVMLNSADAKWKTFLNNIETYKRSLGEVISQPAVSAQSSQTTGGGILLFFKDLAEQYDRGQMGFKRMIVEGGLSIEREIEMSIGLEDAAGSEKKKAAIANFFNQMSDAYEVHSERSKAEILTSQKQYFDDIAKDPNSTEAIKAGAEEKSKALAKAIEESSAKIAEIQRIAAARVAQEVVAGTSGGPGVTAAGVTTGEQWCEGVQNGMSSGRPAINQAASDSMPSSVPGTAEKGSSIGQNFAQGVASGIRTGYGPIGSAVAGMIDWAFSKGKAAAEIQSPSKRAARELGTPFAEGVAAGVNSPKAKAALKQSLKQLFDDLVYEAGRINTKSDRSRDLTEQLFEAVLGDQTRSYTNQLDAVEDFYDELYRIESQKYAERLANISRQEDLIRKRKDLKPEEKRTMLRSLSDSRSDAIADRGDSFRDLGRRRNAALSDTALREIELAQRQLARTTIDSENAMIGVRRSHEQEAQTQHDNELRRFDDRIARMRTERDRWAADSPEFVAWNNRIKDAEEDRADTVVKGAGDIKKARLDDKQATEDYLRSLADFALQSKNAEIDAEQAKLDMLRESGASREVVYAAERELSIRQENFRSQQRFAEINAARDSLLALVQNESQRLQILADANAQMESETRRHQSVLQQINGQQGAGTGIMDLWRRAAAGLPGYRSQFKDFAVGLPSLLGDSFKSGLMNMQEGWSGFWQSAKETFFRALQEMLAEIARAQLIKGLTSLFGSLLGGLAGGGVNMGSDSGAATNISEWFGGGFAGGGVPPMNRISVVGERGPELFVPNASGRILSNDDSRAMMSGGGQTIFQYAPRFEANEKTGAFNKPSAQQAARSGYDMLKRLDNR